MEQPRQPAHWCGYGTEVRRGRGVCKAIRGQGTKFMTAMYYGISICTKRGNPANTFYGEPHNTDWDNPENEIDPNPCVANHRVFSPCMDRPSKAFPDSWPEKLKEVMDQCCPV